MESVCVFVSYAWTSPSHIDWVERLARDLVGIGVSVRIDQWSLQPGVDSARYMESISHDKSISHVIMICDRKYKERADNREAGAGIEAQIITQDFYDLTKSNRYVAILREKDENGKPMIPIFATGRIYIDFTEDADYVVKFDELTRWLYNRPLKSSPPLGVRPAWLDDDQSSTSSTRLPALSCIQAVKKDERHLAPTLNKYLEVLVAEISKIPDVNFQNSSIADEAVKIWQGFVPFRDEYLTVIKEIVTYSVVEEAYQEIHMFFENIISVCVPPKNVTQWNPSQFDYRKFISYELFLLTVAIFTKKSRWDALHLLISQDYVFSPLSYGSSGPSTTYLFFYHQNAAAQLCIEARGRRTQTPLAEIILGRLPDGISQSDVLQADLILYLAFKCSNIEQRKGMWWPECCASRGMDPSNFPIFLRAKSQTYFDKFKKVLGAASADDFKKNVRLIDQEGGPFRGLSHVYFSRSIGVAIEVEEIGTVI